MKQTFKTVRYLMAGSAILALSTGVASAQDDKPHFLGGNFSANVAITTDYTFRGISQSAGDPAIQGGIDWASDIFYVGTWGSTVDFNDDLVNPFTGEGSDGTSTEIDFYAGFTPTVGDVSLDLGFIYYLYPAAPGADDSVIVPTTLDADGQQLAAALGVNPGDTLIDFNDQDYVELYGSASFAVGPAELGFKLVWSPDYYFETGNLILSDVSFSLPLGSTGEVAGSDISFSASGNVAYLAFVDDLVPEGGGFGEDYADFGIGLTATWHGIDFDARFIDTFGLAGNGSTGVFTISKSF